MGRTRLCSHVYSPVKMLSFITIVFLAMLLAPINSLPASTGCEDTAQPIYDAAVVDGDAGEWIPADDFFAPMYRAGKTDKDILSNAYLRYDCSENILYIMVEKATGHPIMVQDGDEVWVKIDGAKKVSSDDEGNAGHTTFAWINKSGAYADGWEASFPLSEGSYDIKIHNNVWDGEEQTASTDKNGLDICIECPGFDYGDAPNDGGLYRYGSASHKIVSGLTVYMGGSVDADPGYSGNINADADDNSDGSDDEDGVTFYIRNNDGSWSLIDGGEFIKNRTYKVVVNVQLESESAKLAAWFDFFIDGEFGNEPEETIIDNELLENTTGGTADIVFEQEFTVPGASSEGTTYLRFRLDCQSDDLTPTGLGHVAGEVEDYVADIESEPPVAVTLTSFSATISGNSVVIEWRVSSEINNAGYNIYKSTSEAGPWAKLNDALIAVPESAVNTSGRRYEYIDDMSRGELFYRLEAVSLDGSSAFYGPVQAATISGLENQQSPTDFTLEQNYPNPFNPSTTIEYALPRAADVSIIVYDLRGTVVKKLVHGKQAAGRHVVVWDAKNRDGEAAASGLYFYKMTADQFTKTRLMTLLK